MSTNQHTRPRIAIIDLTYGSQKYLGDVMEGIASQTYPKDLLTVVLIPNASPDDVVEFTEREIIPNAGAGAEKKYPEVVHLNDGVNRGFSGGNNKGIEWAMERGFEYVFLNNGDLMLKPNVLERLVEELEGRDDAFCAQPLVVHWQHPELVNVAGGVFHLAGYAYAGHNLTPVADLDVTKVQEVTYASGASLLMKTSVLREIGLMEDRFFMYHEDLELGLRAMVAGYKNLLVPDVRALHDYKFSKNKMMFAWIELYRWVVMLGYWKWKTLLLLAPVLFVIELGTIPLALKGGWIKAKLYSYRNLVKPSTWALMASIRKRTQRLRVVPDAVLFEHVVGEIEAQEQSSAIIEKVANPVMKAYRNMLAKLIVW